MKNYFRKLINDYKELLDPSTYAEETLGKEAYTSLKRLILEEGFEFEEELPQSNVYFNPHTNLRLRLPHTLSAHPNLTKEVLKVMAKSKLLSDDSKVIE